MLHVLILFSIFLGFTSTSWAVNLNDTSYESAEVALNVAAKSHKRQLGYLLRSRGIPAANRFTNQNGSKNVSFKAIYERLNDDETMLILYYHDGDDLQVFAVRRDNKGEVLWASNRISEDDLAIQIHNLRISLGFDKQASSRAPRRRGAVSIGATSSVKVAPLEESVAVLSQTLFPPDIVTGIKKSKHLIIVPWGGIGTVPFPILMPPDMHVSLIEQVDIRIAPSLFDLDGQKAGLQNQKRSFQSALVVGNPAFANDPDWALPPLPGAEIEASFVANQFKTTALIGKMATLKNISNAIDGKDMLYLATHGVADIKNPLDKSFIAVTPDESNSGRWTARDIQSQSLPVNLVVLSACQTGLGKIYDAGVVGLARAFQLSGSQQVVMSLWSVSDEATAELMQIFILALKSGDTPSVALQKAMLAERLKRADPMKWASFVIFGL